MVARRPCASAVVAAAGSGTRMGAAVPKQYMDLGGMPIVVRSITALASSGALGELVAAVPPGDEKQFERDIVHRYSLSSLFERGCTVVAGGASRQASVARALGAVSGEYEIVLVHDAARPLVTAREVWAAVEAAEEWGAATCGVAPTDTVKAVMAAQMDRAARLVGETLDRSRLRMIQTPQAFKLSVLRQAHEASGNFEATDDCALVERLGLPVAVVPGSRRNVKITDPLDLTVAEALLGSESRAGAGATCGGAEANGMEMSGMGAASGLEPPTIRLGQGFDLHRLALGRRLVLGGVEIPADLGLVGHSDADVLTHAVIDALLGAAGLGDIGQHYPDTDPAYAGASSIALLSHTVDVIRAAGYRVCSLDTVVIAEQPKVGPFAAQMRESLANAMKVSPGCVNIKGKTTEGLGPTGTGEAIAALAVAMVVDMRSGAAI